MTYNLDTSTLSWYHKNSMEEILKNIWTLVGIILGSSVVAAIINNFVSWYRDRRKERKELVAMANASVLKRVELCYRIRRRAKGEDTAIKNRTHDIQEENEYYRSLLLVESRWYGERYALYLKAIKRLTCDAMKESWKKVGKLSAEMEDEIKLNHEKIEELSRQFSLDSRRFLCFPKRVLMTVHDKFWKVRKYDV